MKTLTLCKIGGAWILIICFVVVMSVLPLGAQQNSVTVTFWNRWGGSRLPLMEKQIADFETEHPNIKIDSLVLPQDRLDQKYLTAIAGGMPPDVMMVYGGTFFPLIVERSGLIPLDEYLKRDKIEGERIFLKPDWEAYLYEGKCYGLPLTTGASRHFLFYDKDQFREVGLNPEKPPTTWQELQDYAARLSVKKNGKLERMGFDVNGVQNLPFMTWLYLNNGKLISDDKRTVLFGNPEGLETLKWMVDYTDRLYGGYEPLLPFTDEVDPSGRVLRVGFYSGKVAMTSQGVWYFFMLSQNAPDKKYGAVLLPYNNRNPKAKVRIQYTPGTSYSIPVGAQHPDEAWEWIKYTCIGKGNKDFFQAQLRPSSVTKYNEDPYYAEHNPFWDVVLENFEKSVSIPILPVQSEIDRINIQMTEEALLHKKTPEEAIKWGVEQTQKIVDKYWAEH